MTPAQRFLITIIQLYQRSLSPDHGWIRRPTCRFTPTCSKYAIMAISRYGIVRGIAFSVRRIVRCNPFVKGGLDHIS